MIGEAYFQTRAQLGTALFSLQTLAGECQAPALTLIALQQLQAGLREPFCFIALGGVKSGKSSLFNALFGRDFCAVDAIDTGHRIQVLRFGDEARDVPLDGAVIESFRPAIFLRDFNLVDAPGASRLAPVQRLLETEFIPRADLVLFVLSASDPWAAEAWEGLQRFDRGQLHRLIVIVQQADLRTPAETNAILKHVERTLEERLGQRRPVFAVSAQKAFEARRQHRDLSGTGFRRLEAFIDSEIVGGAGRREKLAHVARTARTILRELGRHAAEELGRAERDGHRVNQLSRALAGRREESLRQIAGFLWTLAQACEATQRQAEKKLARALTLAGMGRIMLSRRPAWSVELQRDIEQQLREVTARQMESSLEILNTELREDWQDLNDGIERHFPPEVRSLANLPEFREQPAFEPAAPPADAKPLLASAVAAAGAWLRVPAFFLLVLAGLAVHGAFTGRIWKEAAIASAALGAITWIAVALTLRSQILSRFRAHLIASRESTINAIEDRLRQALESFFQQLDDALPPLRQHCASQRRAREPIVARVRQLDETFARCADANVPEDARSETESVSVQS